MKKITLALIFILALTGGAMAQAVMPHTTLNTAIADSATKVINLGAVTANSYTIVAGSALIIDQEAFLVNSVTGTGTSTVANVTRGFNRTYAGPHASGNIVLFGPPNYFYTRNPGAGACTAALQLVLPFVTVNQDSKRVELWNCPNGTWVQETATDSVNMGPTRFCTEAISGFTLLGTFIDTNAYTFGTNTTPVSGTMYYSTIDIPQTMRITGLSMLNGTVAATDKLIFTLHRADGTVLVSTDTSGTTASGVGDFQDIAFSTPFLATGPARYWISLQVNGTTTRFRTVPVQGGAGTAAFTGKLGSSFQGTFGTITALTAGPTGSNPATTSLPTSLIADMAPIACAY